MWTGGEIDTLIKIWPVLIAIVGLVVAVSINSFKRKELEKKQEDFMTKENHELKCTVAGHEIKQFFRIELENFSEKLIRKLANQDKPLVDLIRRNSEMIALLDRRTRHLKDADS